MPTLTCEQCKDSFTVRPSRRNARFCSWECSQMSRRAGITFPNCAQCGEAFRKYASQPHQRFCSISCGLTARNLTQQNPSFTRDVSGERNPMFGKGHKGQFNGMFGKTRELNPSWKGGRKVRKDGYVLVVAPDGHPYAISGGKRYKTKYILEHRLVMERHLGRYLKPEEVVHHIDENPGNNNISNLRLYPNQAAHITDGHG